MVAAFDVFCCCCWCCFLAMARIFGPRCLFSQHHTTHSNSQNQPRVQCSPCVVRDEHDMKRWCFWHCPFHIVCNGINTERIVVVGHVGCIGLSQLQLVILNATRLGCEAHAPFSLFQHTSFEGTVGSAPSAWTKFLSSAKMTFGS